VPENDLSAKAQILISQIEPTVAKMFGQFGNGIHLYLFDAHNAGGKPSFDEKTANHFTLSWDQVSFTWRLPFASALPPKYCPVDNEEMKGNWEFCPFHGVKLHA
jgi:hypothetical protein